MKIHNTGFAVMIEGKDFYKEEGKVCIYSMVKARLKMNELKSMGYEVRAIPYCG